MALASSGQMSIGGSTANRSINVEFGRSATATTSMSQLYRGGGIITSNNTSVPTSGAISLSNFYNATNRVPLSYTFSANTADATVDVTAISGYTAGVSDITITVNNGVWVYATSTSNAGLTLTGGSSGDTITVVNNGFISGMGGNGGIGLGYTGYPGGTALSLGFNTTVDNTNSAAYIGGGGGGGGACNDQHGGAGGGAGGGSGSQGQQTGGANEFAGGAGGAPGSAGANGATGAGVPGGSGGGAGGGGATAYYSSSPFPGGWYAWGGGGGGRIFPGTGGAGQTTSGGTGGAGGSGNSAGGAGASYATGPAAGGGGWGASGGSAVGAGGAGGKAVALNGKTITWVSGNTTRVYGSVS